MTVEFRFAPHQSVIVTAYGLNLIGRVQRCVHGPCVHGPSGNTYDVEYAVDGKIERREFWEDELKART